MGKNRGVIVAIAEMDQNYNDQENDILDYNPIGWSRYYLDFFPQIHSWIRLRLNWLFSLLITLLCRY
jgi:hypothetical protein